MPGTGDGHRVAASAVRRASVADARLIAAIHSRSWRHAYAALLSEELLAARDPRELAADVIRAMTADDADQTFLVVEGGRGPVRKVVGFAVLGLARADSARGVAGPVSQIGQLLRIYVDPKWTGRGYGHALHEAIIETASASGFRALVLWVLPTNATARAFYERHGWTYDGAEQTEYLAGIPVQEVRYIRDV